MKKYLIHIVAIFAVTILTSCADDKTLDGVTYRPYGHFNKEECRNDSVYYEVSWQAVTSGVFFSGFFFIPTVYTFGFNLFEPKAMKKDIVQGQAVQ